MDRVRYGLIGAGGMAQGHLLYLRLMDDAKIVAVADPHPPSLGAFKDKAAGLDIRYLEDYRALLDMKQIDAVVVATPDDTHVGIVCDALSAGKHVLSEKPVATTREDMRTLEAAISRSDRVYQVGLECRYLPVFRRMKRLIEEGAIGAPRMVWCHEFRGPFRPKVGHWIHFQDKTGGTFVEKTCHYFDLMTWFAGSTPKKVAAFAGQDVVKDIYGIKPDVLDNGWVIIEYENGVRASLGLCMFADDPDIEMGVIGPAARMVGHFFKANIEISESEDPPLIEMVGRYKTPSRSSITVKPERKLEELGHGGGVYFEHLEFIECIRTGRKPLTDFTVGKWSVLVGIAAEESARMGGKLVTL